MDEAISRSEVLAFIEDMEKRVNGKDLITDTVMATIKCVKDFLTHMPLAQQKRKTGKWLCSDDLYETAVCSCCGWDTTEPWQHIKSWFEFCPHCGAYMRGE